MKTFNLLAVDDAPDNLFLLEQLVETYLPECRLIIAQSSREGLDLADREPLDAAIIDVQLPEIDGLEMCRRLKARGNSRRIAVMLITAKGSTPKLRAEGLAAGADDFISRPIDNEELVAKLRVMLRLKGSERELSQARDDLELRVTERTIDLAAANAQLKQEIAERKRTEEALQRALAHASQRAAENAALLTSVRAVLEEHDFPDAARTIFESCKKLIGATSGYVSLTSKDGTLAQIAHVDTGGLACAIPIDAPMPIRGLRAQAYQTGHAVYDNAFMSCSSAELLPRGHSPIENVLFAPLLVGGEVVGLLGLANKPGGFTADDARMAAAFGEFASVALNNSRNLHSLQTSERELAVRNRIAGAFLTLTGDEVYAAVLNVVLDALESKHGVFGYIDESGNFVAPSMTSEVFSQCQMENKSFVFPPESWGKSIWGRAISQKTILCSNKPLSVPPGHIAMEREVSSPIIYQDRVIGLINIANKQRDYDQADVDLLRTICLHIAPVLHARLHRDRNEAKRAQAEEALLRAHHELEDRVKERTSELLSTNQRLQTEIAERERAEAALRDTNALLERVFSTTEMSLAYMDTKMNFIRVNRAYAAQGGQLPEHFVGKNHFALYPNEENEAIFRRALATGETVEFYAKPFVYASQPYRGVTYWDWSLHPVKNEAGQVEGLLLCLVDVTSREQAESRVRQHQTQLAHVARLSTMGEMGSAIAHELNQPLCAILASAQASLRLLKSAGGCNPSVIGAIEQVAAQAKRAGEIIRHLRDFSRRRAFHRSTLQIQDVIREAAEFVAAEARPHNVRINLNLPEQLPHVLGDTIQIEQVLINLMRNAIEAMEQTEDQNRRLDITATSREPDMIEIAIQDTGRGLPEGDSDRIFEPFFSTKPEGMGIGLGISRSIIEFHGGRLWADNSPQGGAVFRFTLPAG